MHDHLAANKYQVILEDQLHSVVQTLLMMFSYPRMIWLKLFEWFDEHQVEVNLRPCPF